MYVTSISTESSFPDLDEEPERQDGGKLTYERDFLLQFQSNPMCMLKPEGLPDLEVVLGQARTPSKSGFLITGKTGQAVLMSLGKNPLYNDDCWFFAPIALN